MAIGTPVNRGSAQNATSATTLAVTTTGAIASNSKIILSVGWRTATTLTSVSGGGLTWTVDYQRQNAGATQNCALVSADAPAGLASGTTITATLSGNTTDKGIIVVEVTGLAAQGSCFDRSTGADIATGTSFSTGSTATTTLADELLVSVLFFQAVEASVTWTGSFTGITLTSTAARTTANGYRIVSATGAYAATGTYPTSTTADAIIGTYKMAGGAASITGSAALTGAGSSTTVGFRTRLGASALTGAGTSLVAGVRATSGAAALTGTGVASATGAKKISGAAALTSLGSSLQTGFTNRFAQASLAGAGVLSGTSTSTILPISDSFTRTVASGWGTSTSGHVWTAQSDGGAALSSSVNGSEGLQVVDHSGVAYRRNYITVTNTDVEALLRIGFTALPATGNEAAGINLRLAPPPAASTSYYYYELRVSSAGVLNAQMNVINVGSSTLLGGPTTVTSSYAAGDYYWVRAQCIGSVIRMRVWKDGNTEPSTWTISATNALVASGVRLALFNYPTAAGTGTHSAKYDDVLITQASLGAAALTGAGSTSATGVRKVLGAAALTGQGSQSFTGVRVRYATGPLSGTGTLAATGFRTKVGAANLTGAGTASATGTKTRVGTAALTGTGVLSATGRTAAQITGSAALTGLGSSVQVGYKSRFAQAGLSMTATLTASGFVGRRGAATLSSVGVVSASGTRLGPTVTGSAALSMAQHLGATGKTGRLGTAALSGNGTLVATPVLVTTVFTSAPPLVGQYV